MLINKTLNHVHHIAEPVIIRQPFTIVDAEHLHAFMIHQVRQQLWRNQEVLPNVAVACNIDELVVHCAFSSLIHTLRRALVKIQFLYNADFT